jgi:hypothetical protein
MAQELDPDIRPVALCPGSARTFESRPRIVGISPAGEPLRQLGVRRLSRLRSFAYSIYFGEYDDVYALSVTTFVQPQGPAVQRNSVESPAVLEPDETKH